MIRPLRALTCLCILVLGGGEASALPPVQVERVPGFLLAQAGPAGSEQRAQEDKRGRDDERAPLADLNEVLSATRAKLEELTRAAASVVADTERRNELQAQETENQRLASELEQARALRAELESSGKLAEARIAELARTVEAARRKEAGLSEDLARLRRQNEQLNQRLSRAEAAREAALAEAEKIPAETARKLERATDQVEQSRAELASRDEQLARNRQELAKANGVREQLEARVIALEQVVERSGAEAMELKAQLAEAKEQLGQAAGAAVTAERARQAADSEAQALRGEAERARDELTAVRAEIARFKTANAALEKQIASLHTDSRSATETARRNLMMMEEKIEELNAALDLVRPEGAALTNGPQSKPEAVEAERPAAPRSPSMVRPPAPQSAGQADGDRPADGARTPSLIGTAAATTAGAGAETADLELDKLIDSLPHSRSAAGTARHNPAVMERQADEPNAALDPTRREEAAPTRGPQAAPPAVEDGRTAAPRSASMAQPPAPESTGKSGAGQPADSATRLSMVEPAAGPLVFDSGLAGFQASVQALNQLEVNAGGADLFSGVESVGGREVQVRTTPAWTTLPAVGKESYLASLLDAWVIAREGKGRAVVRIVDPDGRLLVEESWP